LLQQGHVSIFEPGLASLVREGLDGKRLQFTSDEKFAVQHGQCCSSRSAHRPARMARRICVTSCPWATPSRGTANNR
jgi:hypothetical protein